MNTLTLFIEKNTKVKKGLMNTLVAIAGVVTVYLCVLLVHVDVYFQATQHIGRHEWFIKERTDFAKERIDRLVSVPLAYRETFHKTVYDIINGDYGSDGELAIIDLLIDLGVNTTDDQKLLDILNSTMYAVHTEKRMINRVKSNFNLNYEDPFIGFWLKQTTIDPFVIENIELVNKIQLFDYSTFTGKPLHGR